MLEWLIIGGGLHGTHLSLYLTQRRNVPLGAVRVLDPYDEPLALWDHHGRNASLEFLRSAHAHNLSYDPFSLATFAKTQVGAPLARFLEPYGRPSWELFQAHNRFLLDRFNLRSMRLRGRATGLMPLQNGWRVETDEGYIDAKRVVLAMGNTEHPHFPDWAHDLRAAGAPIHHIYEADFDRTQLAGWKHAVIVGGGITAVQTALAMAIQEPSKLTVVMRHSVRVAQFDADPGWVSLYTADYQRVTDYLQRREIISQVRNRGSMPLDVSRDFQTALVSGLLARRVEHITSASYHSDQAEAIPALVASPMPQQVVHTRKLGPGFASRDEVRKRTQELPVLNFAPPPAPTQTAQIHLRLASGDALATDCLILATGFDLARPGGRWLSEAVYAYGLPTAPDGYPIPDRTLAWANGLYVMGPLAELEVGPVSRNIIGARLASERIGAAVD